MAVSSAPLGDITPHRFAEPLREGVVLGRPNRFIMDVAVDGETMRCHCPTVSRIGGLVMEGRPCLVSDSHNPKRKLRHTVEAISLDEPACDSKSWVGINQNASNRHVEHFLAQGAMPAIAERPTRVRREVPLGSSRLDFVVDDTTFVEVKTPLVQLECPIPDTIERLPASPFSSTERALRHMDELAASLAEADRAIILYCLYYENHGFHFFRGTTYGEVMETVDRVRDQGVELWQADLELTAEEVRLRGYRPLEEW